MSWGISIKCYAMRTIRNENAQTKTVEYLFSCRLWRFSHSNDILNCVGIFLLLVFSSNALFAVAANPFFCIFFFFIIFNVWLTICYLLRLYFNSIFFSRKIVNWFGFHCLFFHYLYSNTMRILRLTQPKLNRIWTRNWLNSWMLKSY